MIKSKEGQKRSPLKVKDAKQTKTFLVMKVNTTFEIMFICDNSMLSQDLKSNENGSDELCIDVLHEHISPLRKSKIDEKYPSKKKDLEVMKKNVLSRAKVINKTELENVNCIKVTCI